MVFVEIAFIAPVIEIIYFGGAFDVCVQIVCAGKSALFAGVDGVRGTAAGDFALPIADGNDRGVARFVDVDG